MGQGDIKLKIEGLDEVKKMLSTLNQQVNDKVLSDVYRKAANVVKDELIRSSPDGNDDKKSGDKIASNVVIKKNGRTGWMIGFAKRVFWVKFLELGTAIRSTLGKGKYKKGANRGKIERKPFIEAAHMRAYPAVIDFVNNNFVKVVQKSLKKQADRINRKLTTKK